MADNKEEKPEDEIIAVGPGVDEDSLERDDADADSEDGEGDEEEDGDGEEEDGEQRLGAGDDDDDVGDGKRAKRKTERKTRRARQKEGRDRDARELKYLRADNKRMNDQLQERVGGIEERLGQSEMAQIDSRISTIKTQIVSADKVIATAINQQKGDDATDAQGIRDTLRDNLNRLESAKDILTKRSARRPTDGGGEEGRRPDPRLLSHANDFMERNNWWDPNGGDEDSLIVSAIDFRLAQEGFDPSTPEYWTELDKRVAHRLPHRASEDDGDGDGDGGRKKTNGKGGKKKRSSGPQFRTGGRERPLKSNEVYVSPERKEAMIEAGVWDDPVLRQRYLKAYATHDREHRADA